MITLKPGFYQMVSSESLGSDNIKSTAHRQAAEGRAPSGPSQGHRWGREDSKVCSGRGAKGKGNQAENEKAGNKVEGDLAGVKQTGNRCV